MCVLTAARSTTRSAHTRALFYASSSRGAIDRADAGLHSGDGARAFLQRLPIDRTHANSIRRQRQHTSGARRSSPMSARARIVRQTAKASGLILLAVRIIAHLAATRTPLARMFSLASNTRAAAGGSGGGGGGARPCFCLYFATLSRLSPTWRHRDYNRRRRIVVCECDAHFCCRALIICCLLDKH